MKRDLRPIVHGRHSWRGARDNDPIEARAALEGHLRRSMGADNYAQACDLLNTYVNGLLGLGAGEDDTPSSLRPDAFTEKQRRVGFTGDRSPSRGGESEFTRLFGDCPAPLRL